MRPIVSYSDISTPQSHSSTTLQQSKPPPAKKRKRSHQNQKPKQQHSHQHWDDPGLPGQSMMYGDDDDANGEAEEGEQDDESRELTYEEIWDDSALINAWNAATEEYESYHGPEKDWKKEPVNKSPLWYNIPPSPSQLKKSKIQAGLAPSTSANTEQDMDRDSKPLDFNTFVPDHDPTLTVPAPMQIPDYGSYNISEANGPMVSQDEAFSRAMQAMYWAGYYSAVYHCQKEKAQNSVEGDDEGEELEYEENQENGEDDLIPTQR